MFKTLKGVALGAAIVYFTDKEKGATRRKEALDFLHEKTKDSQEQLEVYGQEVVKQVKEKIHHSQSTGFNRSNNSGGHEKEVAPATGDYT